jgi:hypothetical protein
MKMRCLLILCTIVLGVLAGCTTSRGNLFEDVVEADALADPEAPEKTEPDALTIRSRPSGAEVYINNRYRGTTPLVLKDLSPGQYKIELRLGGHHPATNWISYRGGAAGETIVLDPITGFIDVVVVPEAAEVSLGEQEIRQGLSQVPVGSYTLRARAFGYSDHSATVRVGENQTTQIAVSLEKAEFALLDLVVRRPRFNPLNPGRLGRTVASFRVPGPGTGRVRITDQAGSEVYLADLAPFTTWEQEITWDGRDVSGDIAPDGLYDITVEGSAPQQQDLLSMTAQVTVDTSLTIAYRSLWNGLAGLLYAGSPDVLPEDTLQLSTLLLAHIGDGDYRAPVVLGGRLGVGRRAEVDATAMLLLENVENLPIGGALAGKLRLLDKGSRSWRVSSAATSRLGFLYGTDTDTLTNPSGLAVGVSSGLGLGSFFLVVSPELVASPRPITYETFQADWDPVAWAYARAGMGIDLRSFVTGVSAAARTAPFGRGGLIDLPFQAAWEVHWVVPNTQLVVSFALAGEFRERDDFYMMSGAGLSVLE